MSVDLARQGIGREQASPPAPTTANRADLTAAVNIRVDMGWTQVTV
jgi:hypothetical protein